MSNKTDNREKGKKNTLESDDSSAFMVRVVKNKQGKFVIKHTIHFRRDTCVSKNSLRGGNLQAPCRTAGRLCAERRESLSTGSPAP